MRFASFRVNLKRVGAAVFCAAMCVLALNLTVKAWTLADSPAGDQIWSLYAVSVISDTDASESASQTDAGGSADHPDDVGGEFTSESDVYTGELSVPAHISLERLEVSTDLCKPLDSARVSSLFGYRQNPVTGKYSFHSGYDLAAAHGSDIYAMYAGTVTTAGFDSGYGNYIIIEHEGGFQTLYAHCSKLLCEKGDRVKAGEVIALVGSTGNSTGAHLHVEFRKNGQRYDPEWILGGIY